MGNIIALIIILVIRSAFRRLLQSPKTQAPSMPKRPVTSDEYPLPQVKKTKVVEEKRHLRKPILSGPDKLQHEFKPEPESEPEPEPELKTSGFFNQEDILRGIVFKEILSPPRALMHRRR